MFFTPKDESDTVIQQKWDVVSQQGLVAMLPRQLGFEGLMMPSPRSTQGNKDETSESPTADEDKDEKKVNEVS